MIPEENIQEAQLNIQYQEIPDTHQQQCANKPVSVYYKNIEERKINFEIIKRSLEFNVIDIRNNNKTYKQDEINLSRHHSMQNQSITVIELLQSELGNQAYK